MEWRIDYEWGERPGAYDRAGRSMVEAFNARDALTVWERAGVCVNSRVVCVALVKEDKSKTLKAAGRKKTCEICGREFIAACRGGKKYCSPGCKRQACSKRQWQRRKAARGVEVVAIAKTCVECGKDFTASGKNAKQVKYCSKRCYKRHWNRIFNPIYHAKRKSAHTTGDVYDKTSRRKHSQGGDVHRVAAYLALPAAERYARRGRMSKEELQMAEQMYCQMYGVRK